MISRHHDAYATVRVKCDRAYLRARNFEITAPKSSFEINLLEISRTRECRKRNKIKKKKRKKETEKKKNTRIKSYNEVCRTNNICLLKLFFVPNLLI